MAGLRVAIDARFLGGERKGIGRYLHTLMAGMAVLENAPAFVLISDRQINAPYAPLETETIIAPARSIYTWEQLALPRILRRTGADVFHAPGNALPLNPPRTTVLTLHDTMMFVREFHTAGANRYYAYQRWVLRRAARRCGRVVTVSRTSAEDAARVLGAAVAAKLTIIEEAVDPVFYERRARAGIAALRERLGLPGTYFLHFGAVFPRKNTRLVIDAYKRALQNGVSAALVVGGVSAADEAGLRSWFRDADLGDRAVLVPYLPPAEHATLLAGALALIYPSAYEGFGLPALEAMAAGVPVIASAGGALAETCGDAAVMVDAEVEAVATAIGKMEVDPGLRGRLVAAGVARAGRFTPRRMAERTLAVYRVVAGRGAPGVAPAGPDSYNRTGS